MGFRFVLILLIVLLATGCAQVGTLSGGDRDYDPPRTVFVDPPQNTVRFSSQQVQIRFDEFVELVNPQQNVFMVPNDARPEARLVNKTLHLSWKEQLQPNTTYTIYLNGAIRDITEGNDSLMTYVFSTGDHIDSLAYEADIRDAWTNAPAPNMLVGLFRDPDSLSPLYFTRSDESGHALIRNIKAGNYTVRSFKDEDRDQKINRVEQRGFRPTILQLDSSFIDTVPVRAYTPVDTTPRISTFKFFPPGLFSVGSNIPDLSASTLILNDQKIANERITTFGDSLVFFHQVDTINTAKLIIRGKYQDTLQLFLAAKEKSTPCKFVAETVEPGPKDLISLVTNDLITRLDTASIYIRNESDSSLISSKKISWDHNRIYVEIPRSGVKNISIVLPEASVETLHQKKHPAYNIPITLKSEKELGTIVLKAWRSESPLYAELISQDRKVIRSPYLNSEEKIKLDQFLLPGEYRVRIIEDLNGNQSWDPGDSEMTIEPERVYDFSPVKVRANWELELTLDPKENE